MGCAFGAEVLELRCWWTGPWAVLLGCSPCFFPAAVDPSPQTICPARRPFSYFTRVRRACFNRSFKLRDHPRRSKPRPTRPRARYAASLAIPERKNSSRSSSRPPLTYLHFREVSTRLRNSFYRSCKPRSLLLSTLIPFSPAPTSGEHEAGASDSLSHYFPAFPII